MNYITVIGILMIILGILILITQYNNGDFKEMNQNVGAVHVAFGALFLILGGIYFIISSLS